MSVPSSPFQGSYPHDERSTQLHPDVDMNAEWGGAQVAEIEPRPKSQVNTEMTEMPENLERLGQSVNELEKRLAGVLREYPDSDKAPLGEPRPAFVPHAEQLNSLNSGLRHLRSQIVSILERLEL